MIWCRNQVRKRRVARRLRRGLAGLRAERPGLPADGDGRRVGLHPGEGALHHPGRLLQGRSLRPQVRHRRPADQAGHRLLQQDSHCQVLAHRSVFHFAGFFCAFWPKLISAKMGKLISETVKLISANPRTHFLGCVLCYLLHKLTCIVQEKAK